MKKLILLVVLFSGCIKIESDNQEGKIISRTLNGADTLFTIEHDGHWFITNQDHFIHHPDCRRCFPEKSVVITLPTK